MAIDAKAIVKAESRLRIMKKSSAELQSIVTKEDFSDTWYTFLVACKNIWTSLEQGSKSTAQDRHWFGAKKGERKSDELLQYLFISRDNDEHSIEQVTDRTPGGLAIGGPEKGYSRSIQINGTIGAGGTLIATSLDDKPVLVKKISPKFILSTVTGRDKNVPFSPPSMHKGEKIHNPNPIDVANLAITYFETLIEEARALE